MTRRRYYKIKSAIEEIIEFGASKFFKLLSESELKIPVKDCSEVEESELNNLLRDVVDTNLHHETGL